MAYAWAASFMDEEDRAALLDKAATQKGTASRKKDREEENLRK